MKHTSIGRLSFGHFQTLFFVLASVFLVPEGCRGQERGKPPVQTLQHDTIPLHKSLYILSPSNARISVNEGDTSGYTFFDEKGVKTGFIPEQEIYNRNPYLNAQLPNHRDNGSNSYHSYEVKMLSAEKTKAGLPKNLKSQPSNEVLSRTGRVVIKVVSIDYLQENPHFFTVIYALELFDKNSLEELWVETTIHVYNASAKLISKIVDHHNLQKTFISLDGRYILANTIFDRIGDGTAELGTGILLYDVKKAGVLGEFRNTFIGYDHFLSLSDAKFSFYGYFNIGKLDAAESTDYLPMKFSIDPIKRVIYQQKYKDELPESPQNVSTAFDIRKEVLTSYEVVRF